MKTRRRRPVAFAVAAALSLVAGGCGGTDVEHPETTPVKGTVSYKGKPLDSGTISFVSDGGHTASGPIKSDGTFDLSTFGEGDGAVLGHHRVRVVANNQPVDVMPGSSPGYKPTKDLIPKKYGDAASSGVEATVAKGQTPIEINLK